MRGLIDRRTQKRGIQTNSSYFADMSVQRNTNALRLLIHTQDTSKNMATWDNGSTGGTGTYSGTYTNGTFWLGSSTNNATNGYISEWIVWPSEQDDAGNRTGIQTDVNSYFSI
jgi:hypothetical protein